MSNTLLNQTRNFKPDEHEIYLTIKRDLSWREGFGILLVSCTTMQESLIIDKLKEDIKDKKIDILKLEHSIENLYDLIEKKVKDNPIDILFISGIEKSLASNQYFKRKENPKVSFQKESISPLLSHLNWQRERFRDNFECCLVFTVRKNILKYLVRLAPDFFDWKSGGIQFPVDKDIDLLPLNNLSLTFYGFHLRNNINYGETVVPEANQHWEQLTNLGHTLNIPQLTTLKSQLICYQNNQYKPELEDRQTQSLIHHQAESLDFTIPALNGLEVNGFLCPFRLHDTYAIDLTLTRENPLNLSQLKALNLSSHLQPSLGQSFLLYAEPTVSLGDYPNLANTCINQLFPQNDNLELIAKGSLLNCSIFAYDNGETDPSKHHHILICFNPNFDIHEQIDQANEYLLYLLWSRHKILYAYHQSRICVANTQKRHTKIEQQVNDFSKIAQSDNRLEQFKALLTQLPQESLKYSQLLRELSDHQNTIKAHKKNYCNFIRKLETLPDSDSNFLQPFLKQINNKFQPQIETDLSFLSPAKTLFKELISNIRAIVAIE